MVERRFGGARRPFDRLFSGGSLVGLSDASLLDRYVADQDDDAFAMLESRHGPLVWSVCQSVLRDPVDSEDAFQATFLILARQSRSLRVEGSLAGWLYRVAHRVAVRSSVEARRRRARETAGVNLDAIASPIVEDSPLADLHEAIARLPERFRQAVILCELEGMTQVEASSVLRCGEATLRRRLASARERLRDRLAKRGEAGAMLALARLSIQTSTALARGSMIPSSTAQLLARKVMILMTLARWGKAAVILLGVGVATAALAMKPEPVVPPQPIVQEPLAAKPKPADRVRWVHLKSDTFGETWANLDDGIQFGKDGKTVTMLWLKSHELFTYTGEGPIALTKARNYVEMVDRFGRQLPPSARELAGNLDVDATRVATEEERKLDVFLDYLFETVDGRRMLRADQYVRDALGEPRIEKQVWYDRETRRPVLMRRRLAVALQRQFQREFETTVYDYPADGPSSMIALGVPESAKVVDQEKTRSPRDWAKLPAEVRDALKTQAEAVRRFPRSYRAVTADFNNMLRLEYWSAPDEFVDQWCEMKTSDKRFDLDGNQPRHFRADNQDARERPQDLEREISASQGSLPVDRIVAWFPFEKSVNIVICDGRRGYYLTRFVQGEGNPRLTKVQVGSGGFDQFPRLVDEQWPLLKWDRSRMSPSAPEADTPPGMVVVKVYWPEPEFRCVFTLDPARDFIAVRQDVWSKHRDRWHHSVKRALRFEPLPGGSWYVASWEERARFGGSPEKPPAPDAEQDTPTIQRVTITPMKPEEFPKDIFDGGKLVEDARKHGAVIEVDQ